MLCAAAALGSGLAARADHIVATWNSDVVGNWSNPLNWSSNPLFPSNNANTFDAIINSADAVVTLDVAATIQDFTISNGSLVGGSALTINDAAGFHGGSIVGSGTINILSSLNIGASMRYGGFTTRIFADATATWSAGEIDSADDGGGFTNLGTFIDATDDGWFWNSELTPVFHNTGTFIKSGGSAGFNKSFWAVMNNSNVVNVQSSGIWFAGGGHNSGTFLVAPGSLLQFSDFNELFSGSGAPTTTFSSSAVIDSAGEVRFNNAFGNATTEFAGKYDSFSTVVDAGTLGHVTFTSGAAVNENFDGDLYVYSGTLTFNTNQVGGVFWNYLQLDGGAIDGGDNVVILSNLDWTAGTIDGDGNTIETIGTAGIFPAASVALKNREFRSYTMTLAGGGSVELTDALLVNDSFATWDFVDDQLLRSVAGMAPSVLTNDGLMIKSGGFGAVDLDLVQFENTGTLLVQSGSMRLGGGGFGFGTINISAASQLDISNGEFEGLVTSHYFAPGSVITGGPESRLTFSGVGTTEFHGVGQSDQLHFDGGTIQVGGALHGTIGAMATLPEQVVDVTIDGAAAKIEYIGFLQIGAEGQAAVRVINGAALVNGIGDMAVFNPDARATVVVEGAGSTWTNFDFIRVGGAGQATLSISDGGHVSTSTAVVLADGEGSAGHVTLSGSTLSAVDFLDVGRAGAGTLHILDGSAVTNHDGSAAILDGATADILVSGEGSTWQNNGFMVIGNSGTATMGVENGGLVSTVGSGFVANAAEGVATVNINAGTWDLQQQLAVGVDGAGTMLISNGGRVISLKGTSPTASAGIIGRRGDGVGTVILDGAAATWDAADGAMNIGFGSLTTDDTPGGRGYLSILNGAAMLSADGFIGRLPGGEGTVTIGSTNATPSSWTLSGSLYLGGDAAVAAPSASGRLTIDAGGKFVATTGVTVWNNGQILYNQGTFETGALSLKGGGDVLLAPGSNKTLLATSITTEAASGSRLDLSDNKAIVDYTGDSPVQSIREQIRTGRNGGLWTGNGITSSAAAGSLSTALGYVDNTEMRFASFGGYVVDDTSILIKYTYYGDADLDGDVDGIDVGLWAQNFTGELGGAGTSVWAQGDWDYDGDVDGVDVGLWAQNFTGELGGGGLSDIVVNWPGNPTAAALLQGLGVTLVPEPGSLLLGVGLTALLRRRARQATADRFVCINSR